MSLLLFCMHLHEGMHHGIKTHVKASKVGTLKNKARTLAKHADKSNRLPGFEK